MADGSVHIEAETVAPESSPSAPKKKIERLRLKARPVKQQPRVKSQIAFPYMDLDAAVSVATAIIGAGGVALSREQLAGVMGLSVGSGNFLQKVATARTFGLVTNAQGKYELSSLGFAIVDSAEKRQRKARTDSFLAVPLYRRVYDEFRGKQLPPRPHGLEQAFVRFGVSTKLVGTARVVFERAARQAGFFDAGPERLIEPIIGGAPSAERRAAIDDEPQDEDTGHGSTKSRITSARILHPFIEGLLDALPEPNTNWALEGRAKWLQAAAHNFDLMYKGADGQIVLIEVKKTEGSKTTETD
jgi:hypothetical protein